MGVLKTIEKITTAQLQDIDNADCSQSCHHHIGDQSYLVPHIDYKNRKIQSVQWSLFIFYIYLF